MNSSPTKQSHSTKNSPSRPPFSTINSLNINSLSLNSPSRPSTLRDLIHKSGTALPSKSLSSTTAAAAALAPIGTTKKRSTSPSKRRTNHTSPSKSIRGLDDTFNLENSRDHGARTSPIKSQGQGQGQGTAKGLAAGGGLGRMDVVGNDRDLTRSFSADGRKSPTKKGKHVGYSSLLLQTVRELTF